ncbi:carboxypeptidase-like regulatory domain-containing protein [Methanobrevibacter sp.]|uniref:carboxypeptidase-like regulatory domain-containing protein n=1 Tax=Methanobrevibacter sp. TaxID=66852 RepID=UPI00388FF324
MSAVSADDSINDTAVNDIVLADGTPIDVIEDTASDDDLVNLSECSSIVLHVSDSEGVISVRRDATNAVTLSIESGSWGNIDYVKQYKTSDGYFAHAIVTSNGWLIGNGGVTDGSSFRQIESIASEMVVNNVISNDYLSRIYNIISRDSLGHFVIKASDGTYGVVFPNLYHVSKLEPGQYLVCPNVYSKSQKGTYDASLNPVDAAIRITYTDSYGVNRRNIQTYHWKLTASQNGLSYGVDTYTSNDNGAGVGRSTASLRDDLYYFGTFHSKNSIPMTPDKMYLGTHVFDKTSVEIFKLLTPVSSALVGENIDLKYQVSYVSGSSPVVRFALPEGFTFSSAALSKGTYTYDAAPRVLTWYLNSCDERNYINLSLKALKSGKYEIFYSLNNNFVNSNDLYANDYGVKISSGNVEKYAKGPERLYVYLKDISSNPISGEKVIVSINGVDYTRTTNDKGATSIAINLNPGNYTVTASYNGHFGANSTTSKIRILSTISGNDIVKMFRNATQYYASFKDTSGNPLALKAITFNINGVFYTRNTDANGRAKLNINLNPGTYIITCIDPNGAESSNVIKVLPTLVDGHDLTKYYRNASAYSIRALDGLGNPVVNKDVTFNINGVFYTRATNSSGYANLNIRLQPGEYIVTAQYGEFMHSNIVKVLPTLFGNDTVSYTNESNYTVRLIDGKGNPYFNQSIEFNINGAIYTNMTDENGIAELHVNLQNGEYIVTSSYDEYSITNKITVNSR